MPDFITLSCPSCGHKLQITENIDRFACAACGNEHVVNRTGGIVTLKPVIDSIKNVQVGVDKTASELAIKRISEDILQLQNKVEDIYNQESYLSHLTRSREIWIIIIGLLIFGMLILFANFNENPSFALFGLILLVIGIILGVSVNKISNYYSDIDKAKNEMEATPIKKEIILKEKELAEHKAIVSRRN